MYFPVSDVTVSPLIPVVSAFVVSFFTSMGGVSGAFLLLPFQVSFLGYVHPSVSSTNQIFNIVAIPAGVLRFIKEGRMVWPLVLVTALGCLPGSCLGGYARVHWLSDPRIFKIFVGLVLLYIGVRLLFSTIRDKKQEKSTLQAKAQSATGAYAPAATSMKVTDCTLSWSRLSYTFKGKQYSCSTGTLFLLSLVVGSIGGAYGIGGGALMAPFLVAFFRLPVHTTAGATLLATFVTSVASVLFYSLLALKNPGSFIAPDWSLGILFGLGGIGGIYLGGRCQKRVPAWIIQLGLSMVILFIGIQYIV